MRSEWILDVLSDLKEYAASHDLPQLAEYLDDASLVALTEIASLHEKAQGQIDDDCGTTGAYPGFSGTS